MNEDAAFEELRHAIVKQAVDDWRALCKGKKIQGETFETIRGFFNSELGELLCGGQSHYILRKLEEELKAVA